MSVCLSVLLGLLACSPLGLHFHHVQKGLHVDHVPFEECEVCWGQAQVSQVPQVSEVPQVSQVPQGAAAVSHVS